MAGSAKCFLSHSRCAPLAVLAHTTGCATIQQLPDVYRGVKAKLLTSPSPCYHYRFQLGALCPAAIFNHWDCLHYTNPLGNCQYQHRVLDRLIQTFEKTHFCFVHFRCFIALDTGGHSCVRYGSNDRLRPEKVLRCLSKVDCNVTVVGP